MKVSEIAKATGKENAEVAEAFDLPRDKGYWMKDVADADAAQYVAKNAAEPANVQARFWSPVRNNTLLSHDANPRNDIKIREWAFQTAEDSPEAAYLRQDHVRDVAFVYEVIRDQYADEYDRVDFIGALEKIVYTGQSREGDGPSKEGRDCIRAMLPDDLLNSLPKGAKNDPRELIRRIVKTIRLNTGPSGIIVEV